MPRSSEGTVRLFEKLGFLRSGDSTKYAIAMRKTPKSVNNCPVSVRPLLQLRIAKARRQCDRARLRLTILRMLERQIQKHTLVFGQPGVETSDDGRLCQPERLWIGGKCARRVTEHIARHLVQHDHRSKRGLRIGQKIVTCAAHQSCMQAEKMLPNACIERRVLLEPLVRLSSLESKLQDVLNPPLFRIVGDLRDPPGFARQRNVRPRSSVRQGGSISSVTGRLQYIGELR
jgi:hypothetical protein